MKRREALEKLAKKGILIIVPTILWRNISMAIDLPSLGDLGLGYKDYQQADDDTIREILERNSFPEWFDFVYPIAPNNILGSPLKGEFAFSRDHDYSRIQIRGVHPLDAKFIELKERFNGENIIYTEREENLKKGTQEYDNPLITIFPENRINTPISLANRVMEGDTKDLDETSFIFQGKAKEPQNYTLKLLRNDPLHVEAEVLGENGEPPKIKKIEVMYKEVDGIKVPVEASLIHNIDLKVRNVQFPFRVVLRKR